MCKKIIILFSILIFCCSCAKNDFNKDINKTIVVVSDTHYTGEDFISDSNILYTKEYINPDGRNQMEDEELMSELIKEVNELNPDYVIFTGDILYHGSKISALDFINKTSSINSKVLVIPGNHDLYIQNPYVFKNDNPYIGENLNRESFKELFKDYGYDSLRQDEDSLSYSIIDGDLMLLMLDSTECIFNDYSKVNYAGGYLSDVTLKWIENELKYAKDNNLKVISFSHQNLLMHHELFSTGYQIENWQDLYNLYKKYDVKLNMSGHMHIQNIAEVDGIYDVAQSSYLIYGNRYGILKTYDDKIVYESHQIDNKELIKRSYDVFVNKVQSRDEISSELMAHYFDGDYEYIWDYFNSHPDFEVISFYDDLSKENQHYLEIKY